MSDYGDDYSDYGDEWLYVEDEYMAADDLAEHAVASPPPTTYGDDDAQHEWDRFDYFNDLEYASDGYDDAAFQPHNAKASVIGQKRKRAAKGRRSRKKQKVVGSGAHPTQPSVAVHSPVVWRSQHHRQPTPKLLPDDAQSYALLRNWRDELADTPHWARRSPDPPPGNARAAASPAPLGEAALAREEEMDQHVHVSQDALMAALQRQLAAAGGPLGGMDPQQLLQFAMRMATDKDAGHDIAGEMADAMLEGDEEDEGEDAEENLVSWVAQQRGANKDAAANEPNCPRTSCDTTQPPTPPSCEANRIVAAGESTRSGAKSKSWTAKEAKSTQPANSLKRKAGDEDETDGATKTKKKRAMRSFDASTTASQARNAPTRTTRATRSKK
jgi:hypothetical protein